MEKTKSPTREVSEEKAELSVSEPAAAVQALATPQEHAIALGKVHVYQETVKVGRAGSNPVPGTRDEYDWDHNAASALHRWLPHEHHAGAPIRITRAAYEAALAAASNPNASGHYVPHSAALSPY